MSKKRAIFTIVTCAIAVQLLVAVLIIGLNSENFAFLRNSARNEMEPLGNDYVLEFDPAEDPVEELSIDWQAGPVQVVASKGNFIRITEACGQELSDEEHMKVLVDDGKLDIGWDHNRFRFLAFPFFASAEKSLVVELPESVAQALTEVEVSNVSGDMEVGGIACEEADFSSVSGNIFLADIQCTEFCGGSTTSGDIISQDLTTDVLNFSTTSGALNFQEAAVSEGDFNTVSGELYFQGRADTFNHSTISGDSHAELSACPEELDMSSVSGQLALVLPASASFRAEHSSVSGEFECEFSGKDGAYGTGKPQGGFSFSTTSGDILITAS